ncbi:Protein/nucleic acid deglycase DJ-1 [Thalictrum thalictroides]|uniref:Protein/nucleic acid deglycase DJ-1 n=1 Tax=Thalictrum thalictroides TaxID=46969 RepID=A0A7J6X567_THATH|nr:Protein/nucleic acid deglycase DJ-1 [Thalictrum thalictroides]
MAYLLDCLIIDLAKALSFGKALELRNLAIGSIQLAPMSVEISIEWNFDSNIDFPLFEIVMRSNHGDNYPIRELNSVKWAFSNTPQILVPIANGTEEMEAIMIIDILRRAKANVVVASVEDTLELVASRKVKLVADMFLEEASKLSYDLIVLPGGLPGAQTFANSEKLVYLLRKEMESNRPYGAICASPALVLEPHNLLKGKKATAFPAMCDKLSDQSEADNRVVVDGNLITSRGPGTSMEFSLAIVEKFFGREKASELAKTMVFTFP